MNLLKDKIALVTGGNSGIGLATAKLFQSQGAKVIITARSKETYELARKEHGERFHIIQSDVSKVEEIVELMKQIKKEFGYLDVIFANAGISYIKPVSEFDEKTYDLLFDTNVKGVYYTIQQSADLLRDGASVIINASAAAGMGFSGGSVYGATKAALTAFARNFAAEYAPRKIRFNSISPSLIESPMQNKLGIDAETLKAIEESSRRNPAGRVGHMDEVAQTVLFLASHNSSYINGIELLIDGGGRAAPIGV